MPIRWKVSLSCAVKVPPEVSVSFVRRVCRESLNVKPRNKLPRQLCEVGVVFLGDAAMRSLNKKFRGKNASTDVLSFSAIEGIESNQWERSLGEIFISIPTARRQAKEYGVLLRDEIQRLLIHGVLHLLGYNHERVSRAEAFTMRRMEREIFTKISSTKSAGARDKVS